MHEKKEDAVKDCSVLFGIGDPSPLVVRIKGKRYDRPDRKGGVSYARSLGIKRGKSYFVPADLRPTHIRIYAGKMSFWICKNKGGEVIGSSVATAKGFFIRIPSDARGFSFPGYAYHKEHHYYGEVSWK